MTKAGISEIRRIISAALCAVLLISMAATDVSLAGVKKYTTKGYSLAKYSTKDYIPVKNKKLKKINASGNYYKGYDLYDFAGNDIWMPHILPTKAGSTRNMDMMTMFHLPFAWINGRPNYMNLGNPQSISVTPDGNTAYITYPVDSNKGTGRILVYDLAAMRRLSLDIPGNMGLLRMYGKYPGRFPNDGPALEACIKIGPEIQMGHCSAVSYNPKDKHLWIITKTVYKSNKKPDMQHLWRINMKTLKPDKRLDFKLSTIKKITTSNHFTFDKRGHVYFFAYAGSKQGKCPKGAIKIYQGTISKKNKVSFKLMRNVICNPVVKGNHVQSAGYDLKNDRIYMICDSALMSIPVSKLIKNKVKPADVWMTQFSINREFEGFECDENGTWYLIVNRYPEIMTCKNLAKWDLSDNDFDKNGKCTREDYYYDPINDDPTVGPDDGVDDEESDGSRDNDDPASGLTM
ncbi:MAG: hypothetical protein IJH41_05755 [Eubacterium sp.]|nr:hypothetical protein [Eubacterium sp.]